MRQGAITERAALPGRAVLGPYRGFAKSEMRGAIFFGDNQLTFGRFPLGAIFCIGRRFQGGMDVTRKIAPGCKKFAQAHLTAGALFW